MATDDRGPMERAGDEYDPQIARLPHPYRVMAAYERQAESAGYKLAGDDFYTLVLGKPTFKKLVDLLAQKPLNGQVIDQLRKEDPVFAGFVRQTMAAPGATHEGNLWWLLDYLRWRTQGRHFFQTTDALDRLLRETDIGEGIPAEWIRPPYEIQFLEFGETRSSPILLYHEISKDHLIEGCYVLTGVVPEPLPEHGQRFLEFVFTGSPLGKANNTDDCTTSITLVIPNERATMLEVLEHSLSKNPDRQGLETEEALRTRAAIFHACKILLYLNSDKVVRIPVKERSEMEERLKRLKGGGKAAKLQRQIPRAYDRIVLGPKIAPRSSGEFAETGRHMPTHWRRGHFRNQPFGEGRSQRRLLWIEPVLVRAEEAVAADSKPYLIKEPPGVQ